MKQQQFETEQEHLWGQYRGLLEQLDKPARRRDPKTPLKQFPRLYRRVCTDYALARSRRYSPGLTEDLHDLVSRGYAHLYRRRTDWARQGLDFLVSGFPRALRRHGRLFALSALLFFAPMLAMALGCRQDIELIYSLLDGEGISRLESMYDPTNRKPGRDARRQADTDFAMFGFYVMNNVGIAFRTFALGLVLGVGSLFILVFNGLVIGAAAGHLTALGYGDTFWPFVSGHSALELTAIAISGAAGLLLAAALLAPGRRRRRDALRENAREAIKLVTGALAMLVLAALIEAFWSGEMGIAPAIKYLFGALSWLLVGLYFAFAGRDGRHAS
jgi:uncharacterized membrane protein SpoIIM required for sporulation